MNHEKKDILIGSIGISYGHDRVANTLLNYFDKKSRVSYLDIAETSNPLEALCWNIKRKAFEAITSNKYAAWVYTKATNPAVSPRRNYQLTPWLSMLESYPDIHSKICIATHYSAAAKLAAQFPTITYITDFMAHPGHLNQSIKYYAVPGETVKNDLIKKGIADNKIIDTGIVVPRYLSDSSKEDQINRLKRLASNDPKTILIAIGGGGGHVPEVEQLIRLAINHKWLDENSIYLFLGNSYRLAAHFTSLFPEHINGVNGSYGNLSIIYDPNKWKSFNIADSIIPKIDTIISKPDIWINYALLGIPFLSMSPIGYQEVENHRYAQSKGFVIDANSREMKRLFTSKTMAYQIDKSVAAYSPSMLNGLSNIELLIQKVGSS